MLQSISSSAGDYASLADPPGSSVLVAAVSWIEGTLLGTVATSAAVIAIAAVGFMMLSGRLSVRPGLLVVLGGFVLFGASTIAAGIRSSAGAGASSPVAYTSAPPPLAPEPAPPSRHSVSSAGYDPHAGASVPPE